MTTTLYVATLMDSQHERETDGSSLKLRIYERAELLRLFECEDVIELRLMLAWLRIKPFYVPTEYISVTNYQLPPSVRERAAQLFPQ
jgi:hypothetical protein